MSSQASTDKSSSLRLTQEDVRLLLSDPDGGSRADVARKVADAHSSGEFRETELLIAEQIFRLLLRDTEIRVRAALAEGLKNDPSAPKDVVKSLASDVEEIALPVLEHSEVLDEQDLLEIVRSHSEITKHIAIANRRTVSDAVSAALVDTQNADVVSHLIKNEGADISEGSFKKILDQHSSSSDIIGGVVKRASLPVTVVENLLSIVSDTVADELKSKYGGASKKLEQESQRTREQMTLHLLDSTIDPNEVQMLVDQMYESGRLTPSIILTALCRGNFSFFEASLAKMTGIPTTNARMLINDKGSLGFQSLYRKAGLPDSMFEPCRLVLDVMHEMHEQNELRPGNINFANRVVEKIFMRTEGREVDNLAYIIALIRQNFR